MNADDVLLRHSAPPWFDDAKLGIFVHWGLYSIPAWAPVRANPGVHAGPDEMKRGENAYAEWYENSLRIDGSPTARWHAEHHGDAPYADFRGPFESMAARWDPAPWADVFARAGARYVVLTTKHHDGYLLWPSANPNPFRTDWQSSRDLVGDLGDAVRDRGLRYGLYYSGGLDWTFEPGPIDSTAAFLTAIPTADAYVEYATSHVRELVDRYSPSVLWNDIAWPTEDGLSQLLVDYLAAVPDGTVNDRFLVPAAPRPDDRPRRWRADFSTPEYTSFADAKPFKWEMCRGIGSSFGYNHAEREEHHLAPDDLIRSLVDIVAKGGNLLLNVGPTGDGEIPDIQASRLRALGAWLSANGDGIYGTRPWVHTQATTADGMDVRFTQGGGSVFAFVLGDPSPGAAVTIPHLPRFGTVELLGRGPVEHAWHRGGVDVTWPVQVPTSAAHGLRFSRPERMTR